MSSEIDSRFRSVVEKGRPLIEAFIADLEREATVIKERDLDPRKLADEPRVQDARSSAAEALANLTIFAKSLDTLIRTYSESIENRVDVEKIKGQIAAAPAAARSVIGDHNGLAGAESIEEAGEDAGAKLTAEAELGAAKLEAAAEKEKENAEAVADREKNSTKDMLVALGWVAAAGGVIYAVFRDEKRRRQAKSVAKAAGSGLIVVANSATKKS